MLKGKQMPAAITPLQFHGYVNSALPCQNFTAKRSYTLRCNAVLATDFRKGLLEAQVFKENIQGMAVQCTAVADLHTGEQPCTLTQDHSSVKTDPKHVLFLSSSFYLSLLFLNSPLATNAYYFLQMITISL